MLGYVREDERSRKEIRVKSGIRAKDQRIDWIIFLRIFDGILAVPKAFRVGGS